MNLSANAYAIGPSLHDWEREKWEKQDIEKEIEESRFESYYTAWRSCNYTDLGCVFTRPEKRESVKEEVASVVSLAMSNLEWNSVDSERLNVLLFQFICSEDHTQEVKELLEKYIKPACHELMKEHWQNW